MNEHRNPYASPTSDIRSTSKDVHGEPLPRRPNYVSESLFLLVAIFAVVSSPDANDIGVYVAVVWLSGWLSSLIYQRIRISRSIKPMRGTAMLVGLAFAMLMTNTMNSQQVAIVAGVIAAGTVSLFRFNRQ